MEVEQILSDETSSEASLDKVFQSDNHKETETERLVRLGEMTPFGSLVKDFDGIGSGHVVTESDQLKRDHEIIDSTISTNDDGNDSSKTGEYYDDSGLNDSNLESDFDSEEKVGEVESDEEYIPDDEELKLSFRDDEHFMPDDDLDEPVHDVKVVTKEKHGLKGKVIKKTKKGKHLVKDDGDNRTYQIRIRYTADFQYHVHPIGCNEHVVFDSS